MFFQVSKTILYETPTVVIGKQHAQTILKKKFLFVSLQKV